MMLRRQFERQVDNYQSLIIPANERAVKNFEEIKIKGLSAH